MKYTIQTSGTKVMAADSKDGPWSYARDYYVWLPPNYDKDQPYPLVLQAPGCGVDGTQIYSLSPSNSSAGIGVNGSVIRVGLTPPPNAIGHATSPGQGCFDDREGDDSVEWPFYEALIDKLKNELCYDENRVFASGTSSGAWLANELSCKYAGNTSGYAIRGVLANQGGLPTDKKYLPTCTNQPSAGTWVYQVVEPGSAFDGSSIPITRAMKTNQCAQDSYPAAEFDDFPIGNGKPDSTCKKIRGCPAEFPLVVCALPVNSPTAHDDTVNPAFATFLQGLEAP